MSIENASFDGDVSRGSPLVEVGRTTTHGEGNCLVSQRRWVWLFGTGVEHTIEQMMTSEPWLKIEHSVAKNRPYFSDGCLVSATAVGQVDGPSKQGPRV